MENDLVVWDKLVEKVSPLSATDNIEEISIDITRGGIIAMTTKPSSFSFQESDVPENEQVFIYEEFGIDLKNRIRKRISDAIIDAPLKTDYQLARCTVTEEEIHPVYELSYYTTETWIKEWLAEVLSTEGMIKQPSNLAYGTIDTVYYSPEDPFKGWTFDGTLYRYTKEPFDYWSEPTNMDEWVDFASESEREETVVRNRDRHLIHFHPMQNGLSVNHPYIKWFKSVEEHSQNQYDVNGDVVESFNLVKVDIDNVGATICNTIVL